jgi:hypothetical protein
MGQLYSEAYFQVFFLFHFLDETRLAREGHMLALDEKVHPIELYE